MPVEQNETTQTPNFTPKEQKLLAALKSFFTADGYGTQAQRVVLDAVKERLSLSDEATQEDVMHAITYGLQKNSDRVKAEEQQTIDIISHPDKEALASADRSATSAVERQVPALTELVHRSGLEVMTPAYTQLEQQFYAEVETSLKRNGVSLEEQKFLDLLKERLEQDGQMTTAEVRGLAYSMRAAFGGGKAGALLYGNADLNQLNVESIMRIASKTIGAVERF